MEQVDGKWPFDVPPSAAVITTKYVTVRRMPILYVSHDPDEAEGGAWQFHCGNGDYATAVLQLVRLDEILRFDPELVVLASLPIGHEARRANVGARWTTQAQSTE